MWIHQHGSPESRVIGTGEAYRKVENFLSPSSVLYIETSFPDPLCRVAVREENDNDAGDLPELVNLSSGLSEAEEKYRHGRWIDARSHMLSLFEQASVPSGRIERFYNCGASAVVVVRVADGRPFVWSRRCKDRLCRPCGQARSHVISQNLECLCERSPTKLLTLTLRHSEDPVRQQIRRLIGSFALMRSHPLWQRCVWAGAWFVECKVSEATNQWHIHMHIVLKADYIPWYALKAMWLYATGDSDIIDIQEATAGQTGVFYAGKYAAKGFENDLYDSPSAIAVLLTALRSVRLYGTFGKWRRFRLARNSHSEADYDTFGSLNATIADARNGDARSVDILSGFPPERAIDLVGVDADTWAKMVSEATRELRGTGPRPIGYSVAGRGVEMHCAPA